MSLDPGYVPTLSPRFATYVRDYLMDHGVNPGPVFTRCGVDFTSDEEYDTPLPLERVACLMETASEVTGNPTMGLSMGQDFHYESSSLLIVAMLAAPSVGEGLKLLNAYDRFVDSGITTGFYPSRSPAEFTADLLHESGHEMVQLNDYLMAFLAKTLATATRKPVPMLEVTLQHPEPEDTSAAQALFDCQIVYSAPHNCIRFHPRYLEEPFLTSNKMLFRVLTNAMEVYFSLGTHTNGFVSNVCRHIMLEEPFAQADSATIAGRLSISPRTLRRRLADEGLSFKEVKNLARERQAKYLLANTNSSLTEIAFELGYSELSAFSRAFRAWSGETPHAYRENVRALLR